MARKSKKLEIKKLQINFTNRWLYTLIVFFSLVVIGVFVYATAPNPGHDITQIAEPSDCGDGEFLKWTGSSWTCEAVSDEVGIDGSGTTNYISKFTGATTLGNSVIYETAGNIGIDGNVYANAFIGDGSGLMNLIVKVTATNDACNGGNDGILRYRSDECSGDDVRTSTIDICMKEGASSYDWYILKTSSWTDTACDTDGCPPDQTYYQCTGYYADPGCYGSMPYGCYSEEGVPCFLAGTEILMADGTYKNIEQVKEGEWIISYDIENNLKTISKVAYSLVHEDVEGYVIINGELEVTSNHPMWIVNRQEWAQVHTIELRDILLDSNGQKSIVISLEDINGVNIVYNLELEGDYNNYFAEDILVHNKLP